jgi:hypothetical protein
LRPQKPEEMADESKPRHLDSLIHHYIPPFPTTQAKKGQKDEPEQGLNQIRRFSVNSCKNRDLPETLNVGSRVRVEQRRASGRSRHLHS